MKCKWQEGIVLQEHKWGQQITIESLAGGKFRCQNKGFITGDLVSFVLGPDKQTVIALLPTEIAKLKEQLARKTEFEYLSLIGGNDGNRDEDDSQRQARSKAFDSGRNEIGEDVYGWSCDGEYTYPLRFFAGRYDGARDDNFSGPGQAVDNYDEIFSEYEEISEMVKRP